MFQVAGWCCHRPKRASPVACRCTNSWCRCSPRLVGRGGHLFRTPRGEPYPVTQGTSGQIKTAIKGARIHTGIRDVSPYTGRHTVSTQLVINGVHAHIKDQILGHVVTDMSRQYTHVPQAPLIKAINTLPVISEWASAPWVSDPLAHAREIVSQRRKSSDAQEPASECPQVEIRA